MIMAKKGYDAGVKEYRDTYWMPEYQPKDTDILACFKITPFRKINDKAFYCLEVDSQCPFQTGFLSVQTLQILLGF